MYVRLYVIAHNFFSCAIFQGSSSVVTSVTFALSNLLVVIDGDVSIIDLMDTGELTPSAGIEHNVTDIVSFQCCWSRREWCKVSWNIGPYK